MASFSLDRPVLVTWASACPAATPWLASAWSAAVTAISGLRGVGGRGGLRVGGRGGGLGRGGFGLGRAGLEGRDVAGGDERRVLPLEVGLDVVVAVTVAVVGGLGRRLER